MKNNNPFPFSDDNKRYYTWNYYLKHTFHSKVFKVALNANFTCPNRDGTCGVGGCTFCGSLGSGDTAGNALDSLQEQFEKQKTMMLNKWPNGKAMAYFQAYSNTYAPLPILQQTFQPFIKRDDVIGLCIATRADCLSEETIQYLDSLTLTKEIWIELGLQSMHDATAELINRGHTYQRFVDCITRLSKTRCKLSVHIINSLPNETKEQMLATVDALAHLPIHALKIHMLHIMEGTQLALTYQQHPFPILDKDAYIDIVIQQLERLPETMIIQRVTGDGIRNQLIAPLWTLQKKVVMNDIDKEMRKRNTWQGKYFR